MRFIVKNTTKINPLDLICPHHCRNCGKIGEILCQCCKKDITKDHQNHCPICKQETNGVCEKCQTPLDAIWMAGWRDEKIGDLAKTYKYQAIRSLAPILANIINDILPYISGEVVVVPLPTISKHIRMRGFDHTKLIAKNLTKFAERKTWRTAPVILRKNATVQVGNNAELRKKQAEEAYEINPKITINKETTYLLLDDIWTTGSTITAAANLLRKNGAEKVAAVVLAANRLSQDSREEN